MRQTYSAASTRDYSGIFLAAILFGVVVIVLGLTMAG
jgi:hypothetical protein